ncbi:MAG: Transcriptional regulatory protein ZraR [Syntrophorhabdaceae bacterium PtaU1.Bin034]|nr:MAG: Transcriptional regulatory protein ZraR [Syntrophorhabdaceae bacterium PtaU1.Bin034]
MSMKRRRILVIDDDPSQLESLEMFFLEKGCEVSSALNGLDGIARMDFQPDVVILDIHLPDLDGLAVLSELKKKNGSVRAIIITAFHDMEITIKAMKLGAVDYITKPIDIRELDSAVEKAFRLSGSAEKDAGLVEPQILTAGEIVGRSKEMKEIFKAIGILCENRVTVLLQGETGTGKELIARAIHYHSPHKDYPFIAINCSALVSTLLESELFGHEKGSFTGAISTKRGKFELAGEGTIFLDEASEISLESQPKLLRFLQEKEFERVGGEKTLKSNARVIAATNKDLGEMVKNGTFRRDLFYRLSVATIRVPPLRERKDDIRLLVEHLLKKINRELHRSVTRIEDHALRRMLKYDWPGNVRELENVLTNCIINTRGNIILDDLVCHLIGDGEPDGHDSVEGGAEPSPTFRLDNVEKEHILRILDKTHWHYGKACDLLGISRPTLRQKLQKYGIPLKGKDEADE